jgi:hypothetical protein
MTRTTSSILTPLGDPFSRGRIVTPPSLPRARQRRLMPEPLD